MSETQRIGVQAEQVVAAFFRYPDAKDQERLRSGISGLSSIAITQESSLSNKHQANRNRRESRRDLC